MTSPQTPKKQPIISDFATAARAVLAFLHRTCGMALWVVTRTDGTDLIVLQTCQPEQAYPIHPGTTFRWCDSFCSRMVSGEAPQAAPDVRLVPAYLAAPGGAHLDIRAYVGVPLRRADGALFGTLCAISPEQHPTLADHLPLIQLQADLLSALLDRELQWEGERRAADRAKALATTDELTGLFNRRGWTTLTTAEQERCDRYGHFVSVISIDLDGLKQVNDTEGHVAGDALLSEAARVLRNTVRPSDIVARLGGDEFAVLAVECNGDAGQALARRLQDALDAADVAASVGAEARRSGESIAAALDRADDLMYDDKRRRRCEADRCPARVAA